EKLLEFSIFIKDKKSINPVSILSVVSNNNEAEINILKARIKLEEYVKQASASETHVNIITTIDHNTASGIARISREIMADIIILGWPRRVGLLDKLIGEKMDSILSNTDKTTFICHLEKPLILHKRIVIAAPPLSEHEYGFELWVTKIAQLAQELSVPMHLYSNEPTQKAVEKHFKKTKLTAAITMHSFLDWDNTLVLAQNILPDDLFVLASARRGSTSYISALENLPTKLEKQFPTNSRLVIYPQQFHHSYDGYDEVYQEPLSKGIETIQKIGKGIESIFKKDGE